MMKKEYIKPEVTFVDFTYNRIIAASGCWDDAIAVDDGDDMCMNA